MMTTTARPLVGDYLRRLERAARRLARHQRDELLAEIRSHIHSGLGPDATEADVRNLLDDLGEPADIVAAAQPDRAPARRSANEIVALVLLVTGLPPVLGWLVGVWLLLRSPAWSRDQKLLAMLVWPGGYAVTVGVTLAVRLSEGTFFPSALGDLFDDPTWYYEVGASAWLVCALVAVLVVPPALVAAHLYRDAGRGPTLSERTGR